MNDLLKLRIKSVIRRLPLFCQAQRWRQRARYGEWIDQGKPLPPPHLYKQGIVRHFAKKHNLRLFVETGTYLGDMIAAVLSVFDRIYSIELSREIFQQATKRFVHFSHVTLLNGDSAEILPGLLAAIDQPCLFWLDAHYSAGFTARAEDETPIEKELAGIFEHPLAARHVVLIDDARHFDGTSGYPTIRALEEFARRHKLQPPRVENDIIIFNGYLI